MDGEPTQPNTNGEQKINGALVGSVVIILLLILGGIYLARKIIEERSSPMNSSLSSVDDNNL
jgi:LPXTG-motif cell wall-anchored protein